MNTEHVIVTEQLSRSFGTLQAVKAVNLLVPEGVVYGFLGPNGAGKTTTIRMTLGFNVVKGTCVTPLDPRTEKDQRKIDRALARQAKQFYAGLATPAYPAPTLLMVFRMGRSTIRQMLDDSRRDYRYYAEKGWFESDYYYPTRLGVLKKVAGNLVDSMAPTLRKMLSS